jgi:hypothetical protein
MKMSNLKYFTFNMEDEGKKDACLPAMYQCQDDVLCVLGLALHDSTSIARRRITGPSQVAFVTLATIFGTLN